jgi:hypothetical protein
LPSEVQSRVSPADIPAPAQLHVLAGQTTASRLLGPFRLTPTDVPLAELVLKLWPSTVALPPRRNHDTVSLGPCADCEVTTDIESAQVDVVASNSSASIAPITRRPAARSAEPNPARAAPRAAITGTPSKGDERKCIDRKQCERASYWTKAYRSSFPPRANTAIAILGRGLRLYAADSIWRSPIGAEADSDAQIVPPSIRWSK